jgi:UDP-GlcNAc:undecaprenyl-phosphate GlcNAc-1-phosphate transferase
VGLAFIVPTTIGGLGGGALVVVVAVVLMNGVNFLDGLDALAAGVVAVACVAFAIVLHGGGRDVAVATAGALVGFLVYNRPPAKVYLGDAGAYLLGATLALIVAVPVAEVAFAVVRRARARQSITSGDRRHPYDLVVTSGRSTLAAALAYIAVEVVLAAVSVAVSKSHALTGPVVAVVATTAVIVVAAASCGALSPGPEGRA